MSLTTFSKFYFDFQVNSDQYIISFDEGSGEILAEVDIGNYSIEQAMPKVASAMTDAGTQAYSVVFDRSTRLVTISAPLAFTLKVATSSVVPTLFAELGFTGADRTGINAYAGNEFCGLQYKPQFIIQDHVDKAHFIKSVDATVKKTATGLIEVVRFGSEKFIQMNIKYATNKNVGHDVIRTNPNGVNDLADFMSFIIQKQPIEFMANESDPNTFETLILERTPQESNGTAFQLKELYDKNLPGFFETGVLLFRVVE